MHACEYVLVSVCACVRECTCTSVSTCEFARECMHRECMHAWVHAHAQVHERVTCMSRGCHMGVAWVSRGCERLGHITPSTINKLPNVLIKMFQFISVFIFFNFERKTGRIKTVYQLFSWLENVRAPKWPKKVKMPQASAEKSRGSLISTRPTRGENLRQD